MAKEEMNAFDIRALVREMQAYKGGRFDKAYEPTKGELLLRARGGSPPAKFDISILVGKAVHVTALPRENPDKPTGFVMQLRKHLGNGFFDEIRQHGFDRIVEFVFNRKDGVYVLVVELFADGNVVLVKDDKILAPLFHQSWATRQVRPGADWVPPPARLDPFTLTAEEFGEKLAASTADVVRTLATELNLGGLYAEEVCAIAAVPKGTPVSELTDDEKTALLDALRGLLARVNTGELDPVVVMDGETKIDVAPFPLSRHAGKTFERYPTFQEALDAYYGKAVTVEKVDPRVRKVNDERTKVQRMLDAQRAALIKFEKQDEELRLKGDVIYANFDIAQRVTAALGTASKAIGWDAMWEKLKEGRAAKNPEAMIVESVASHEGTAVLALKNEEGKILRVTVDVRKSVQENADNYYMKSKKMREKRKGAVVALENTLARMKDLDERGVELVADIEEKLARAAPTKRFWFESFRWFFTSDDHLVLAGRDVKTNERIFAKQLEANDRYLHADVSGAPSTVVKAKDGTVSEIALEEAACFAASNSRTWNAGHAAGEAYWVTPEQVSKTPNPGEYVAKGSFIVRGKRNFIRAPTRLAIGEVTVLGERKIMGGPVSAVAAKAKRYVVIVPGTLQTNKLANELSQAFDVLVEEVQAVMPPAGVEVVERHGFEDDAKKPAPR